MKALRLLLLVACAAVCAFAQSYTIGGGLGTSTTIIGAFSSCGPPTYNCSNTSSATFQLPTPLPNMGGLIGANTVIHDNISNARILRVTDTGTGDNPNPSNCPIGVSDSSYTADYSGNMSDGNWSQKINGTYYVGIGRVSGNFLCITPFVPGTYQVHAPVATINSKSIWWSHNPATPYVIWVLEGGTCNTANPCPTGTDPNCQVGANPSGASKCIVKYDYSSGWTTPNITKIYDFFATGNALASVASGGSTSETVFTVSQDDSTFFWGLSDQGNQGTGHLIVAFRPPSGYRVLNMGTATDAGYAGCTVNGTWGTNGKPNYVNTSHNGVCGEYLGDASTGNGLHEVFGPGNGNWLLIDGGCTTDGTTKCSAQDEPWMWNFGDTTANGLNIIGTSYSGHFTFSFNNMSHGIGGGQFDVSSMANPPVQTPTIPAANLNFPSTPPLQQHSTWSAAGTSDSNFFFAEWDATDYQNTNGFLYNGITNPFNAAYEYEYTGYPPVTPGGTTPATNVIHRFFHTYNTGINVNFHFGAAYQIGVCSQDGAFCSFSSNWACTLGPITGSGPVVCGGANWVKSTAYTLNQEIVPANANASRHTYHAQAACTTGTGAPTWVAGNVTETTGTGCVWVYDGDENDRTDVFIGELL